MKRILSTTCLVVIFGLLSFSQIVTKEWIGTIYKPSYGDLLTYGVDFFGTEYDFEVYIKELSPRSIAFDYYMSDQNKTQGTVNISGEALNSARVQMNYFTGGEITLKDMTSVFLSQTVFHELFGNEMKTRISPDGGASWIELMDMVGSNAYSVVIMDNENLKGVDFQIDDLAHYYAESQDGSAKYWINYDGKYPLILKMDLGWTITLKHIERAH